MNAKQTKCETTSTTKTAIVTGASSGLGQSYCRMLAEEGYRLVIVARREPQLLKLRDELIGQYGVEVDVQLVDLADDLRVRELCQYVSKIDDLEILVNNAGFGTVGCIAEVDIEPQVDMIQVHVTSLVRLCHAALPAMIRRNSGRIINVASIAGFMYGAGSAIYRASKGCVISFSESLQAEVAEQGVRVQALCPGLIRTEFHYTHEMESFEPSQIPRFMWMDADYVTQCSLRQIEKRKNRVVCVPKLMYRIMLAAIRTPILGPLIQAKTDGAVDRT